MARRCPAGPCRLSIVLVCACLCPLPAVAQDLFELEVFPSATAGEGETRIGIHANGLPGRAVAAASPTIDHPFHASVELSHGWTDRFETAVFLETAPLARAQGARFAGGHVRPKYRFARPPGLPFDVSLAVEYAINRIVFDDNRQTLEFVPILERRQGRLSLVANPEWAIAIKGPENASLPKFSTAAKVQWQTRPRVSMGFEYFWKTEALKHFDPDIDRHHFLLAVMDVRLSDDWELNIGAGRCLTDPRENWIVKMIVGYRLR